MNHEALLSQQGMQHNNGLHCKGARPAQLLTLQEASSSQGSNVKPFRSSNIMKPT